MTPTISPRESFVARIDGVDLRLPVDQETFGQLRSALDDHSVLIISGKVINDEQQIEFSNLWGPMEPTRGVNPASGTPFARQSNLDINAGTIIPANDRRMDYQKGNYQWHADSTFKPTPSLCSILSAREVPSEGGNTEFVSTRAAWESLDDAMKSRIEDLIVEHDFSVSRRRVGFEFTPEEAALNPAVRHPLVQTNPATGRRSLLIGAHAARIIGWSDEQGEALLEELLTHATQAQAVYSHHWSDGEVVIWDNRSVLHRATAYDSANTRRLMQRTTISNPDILKSDAYAQVNEQA